jgi:hypothetical protein
MPKLMLTIHLSTHRLHHTIIIITISSTLFHCTRPHNSGCSSWTSCVESDVAFLLPFWFLVLDLKGFRGFHVQVASQTAGLLPMERCQTLYVERTCWCLPTKLLLLLEQRDGATSCSEFVMFWVHKLLRCLGLWLLTSTIILIILAVEIIPVKLLQQCCLPCCSSTTQLSTTCSKLRCYHRNVLTSSECVSGLSESSGVFLLVLVVHEDM